jgi:hypothetical protein
LSRAFRLASSYSSRSGSNAGPSVRSNPTTLPAVVGKHSESWPLHKSGTMGRLNPLLAFLDLLRASLASGHANLQSRDGAMPVAAGACGWRVGSAGAGSPMGHCVGWLDEENLYLEPVAAYRVVQLAARDSGEPFSTSEQTLKKRFRDKGLLLSIDKKRQTLTVRRTLAGSSRAVLHLQRSTLLPDDPDEAVGEVTVEEAQFVG